MKWQRAVTYEVEADTLEEAIELWGEDGPELGSAVRTVDANPFELVEEE